MSVPKSWAEWDKLQDDINSEDAEEREAAANTIRDIYNEMEKLRTDIEAYRRVLKAELR